MSYATLLKHRCSLLDLTEDFVNGIPVMQWGLVATNVRCFLDLNFIRRGKDPMWTPEAGRTGSLGHAHQDDPRPRGHVPDRGRGR
jgi:hypothetical protein